MDSLISELQTACARMFDRLVTPSRAKIAYGRMDLADFAELDEATLAPILEKLSFGDNRILRPVAAPPNGYEIFMTFW